MFLSLSRFFAAICPVDVLAMCRLYGFQSSFPVFPYLLTQADTGFVALSSKHRDGWGMACYQGEQLSVTHSLQQAKQDTRFQELGQILATSMIAHLRLATIGDQRVTNNHPFAYQNWTFAHNGNIKHFDRYRHLILSQISPHFKFQIQGDTDSELIFLFILTELDRWGYVINPIYYSTRELGQAVKWALENLLSLIGPFLHEAGEPTETYISFLMSNGHVMLAHQGGQPLYYLDRTHCDRREESRERADIREIVFCSTPLGQAENWVTLQTGELLVVEKNLQTYLIKGY